MDRLKSIAGSNWVSSIISSFVTILGTLGVLAGTGIFNMKVDLTEVRSAVTHATGELTAIKATVTRLEDRVQDKMDVGTQKDASLAADLAVVKAQHAVMMQDMERIKTVIDGRRASGPIR